MVSPTSIIKCNRLKSHGSLINCHYFNSTLNSNYEKKVPGIYQAGKPDEEKLQLVSEIANLLPRITDELQMKAALAMECDYKVIKAYLAGNIESCAFARTLIKVLYYLIDISTEINPDEQQEISYDKLILIIATLSYKTHGKCDAIAAQVNFLEKKINDSLQRLQLTVNEMYYKLIDRKPGQ